MKLTADLHKLLNAAARIAAEEKRDCFGIPELMLALLADPGEAREIMEHMLHGDSHRQALLEHFTDSARAIAEERDKLSAEERTLTPIEGVALPADPVLGQLLAAWGRERGEEELDTALLLQVMLGNWSALYPVPLDKLGFAPAKEEQEDFLEALFCAENELNQRYGNQPMHGLLPYTEYKRSMMEVLIRRYRQNLLLYGPPGSGKTSVLRRLVEDTAAGRVPAIFRGKRFFEFQIEVFLKGVEGRGELRTRFERLQLFLEEHTDYVIVLDAPARMFSQDNPLVMDFVNHLFRMLHLKSLHYVLLTDLEFYNGIFKSNPNFEEVLSPLYVSPLSRKEVTQIILEVKDRFEEQYSIEVSQDQVEELVTMADEHIKSISFPKKALILLDVTLSILALDEGEGNWDSALGTALQRITGQEQKEFLHPTQRLDRLEESLRKSIIGQDAAVSEVCRSIRLMKSDLDLNPERPDGVFLLAGPSGVGKQLFATELSRIVYGCEPFVIDMAEFQEAESMVRLIGSISQGEGYRVRPVIDLFRENTRRVLLVKNLEFAAGEVLGYLLQGFNEGYLRDALGQRISIAETTVLLLSDLLGMDPQRSTIGFGDRKEAEQLSDKDLRNYFSGELLRAVDKLVVFQTLGEDSLLRILQERIVPSFREKVNRLGHQLEVDEAVTERVAHLGQQEECNARNVDRKFEELVAERVNEEILAAGGRALRIRVGLQADQVAVEVLA